MKTQLQNYLTQEERTLKFVERVTGISYMKLYRFMNDLQKTLNTTDSQDLEEFLKVEGYLTEPVFFVHTPIGPVRFFDNPFDAEEAANEEAEKISMQSHGQSKFCHELCWGKVAQQGRYVKEDNRTLLEDA